MRAFCLRTALNDPRCYKFNVQTFDITHSFKCALFNPHSLILQQHTPILVTAEEERNSIARGEKRKPKILHKEIFDF
jgi:hypothetical protein